MTARELRRILKTALDYRTLLMMPDGVNVYGVSTIDRRSVVHYTDGVKLTVEHNPGTRAKVVHSNR